MKRAEKIMGLLVLLMTALGTRITGDAYLKTQGEVQVESGVIVIDPGHGGKDPGKVGCHNEIEKDINLAIAMLVVEQLEEKGFEVILTRSADTTATGIYDSTKNEDMQKRVSVINEAKPVCCVSIHQNSYTQSGVRGAQSFFYPDSEESKKLANCIQRALIERADPNNTRKIKENKDYYLLKQTTCPTVIVECGFLSDEDESLKLKDPAYQSLLATAIVEGILEYVDSK